MTQVTKKTDATQPRKTATVRKTQVLLVDDHPMVRQGMKQMIERQAGFKVCAETDSASEAISLIREHEPDIAIVDITLADTSGVELVKDIRAMFDQTKVIVASMHDESIYAERCMRAGAMAYVNKQSSGDELCEALRQVGNGHVYVSSATSDRLLKQMVSGEKSENKGLANSVEALSDRELEVFQMIGQGLRTREIAERLCLSIKTIETYRENIKQKLELEHGTELIRRAVYWDLAQQQGGANLPTPQTSEA